MRTNGNRLDEYSEGWPKWADVYAVWNDARVPEVREIQFQIGEHYQMLPWLELDSARQIDLGARPTNDTAYHLIGSIRNKHDEFKAAYKLYAYCRDRGLSDFASFVLAPIFKQHGENLQSWWHSNARNVLPWYEDVRSRFDTYKNSKEQRANWKELVQAAASAWAQIAETWGVIRIPEWMDRNSEGYKEYEVHVEALHEKRERQEFERLKQKFGQ